MALMEYRDVAQMAPEECPKSPEARDTVETTVEIVTPEKAALWTDEDTINTHNRAIDSRRVMAYAHDMENDVWKFNNDGICFDVNGILLNGQHRLHACVVSQKPFKSIVIRGLPPETQETMDQHRVRSMAGILQLRGYGRCAHLGGAARALVNLANAGDGYQSYRATNQELLTIIERHTGLSESIAVAKGCRGISPSVLGAMHYAGKVLLKNEERANAFVEVFNTGVPDYPGDPAHLFRENILRHQERKTSKIESVRFFSMIRAWNAFVKKENWGKWVSPSGAIVMDGLTPEMI